MFETATRQKWVPLSTMTKPTGGGLTTIDLPRSGILGRIYLAISGTIAGTLSNPNQFGMSSVLNRVKLTLNSGVDQFNVSGAGYHWLLRDVIDLFPDQNPQSNGRNVVTATTFNLDMVIPVAINLRDPYGYLLLQNDQTLATLSIDWASDATVATGATVTATAIPTLQLFEVPAKKQDYPPFNLLHQVYEDSQTLSGAGDVTYLVPRGNTLVGIYHLTIPAWTRAILRAQQSITIEDWTPALHLVKSNSVFGRDLTLTGGAITGTNKRIFYDFLGTDGLGAYGSLRDPIQSARLTDLASVVSVAAGGSFVTIRRQMINL